MEKNDYKYGYYIISLEKKNIFYVFKKKGGKYSFRIIGEILINKLRYYEKEEPGLEMQIESLDINIKEKFFEYLKKENKDLVVLSNINIQRILLQFLKWGFGVGDWGFMGFGNSYLIC